MIPINIQPITKFSDIQTKMTKLQEQMALLKKLPATRVAYYGCLLVAIAIEFAFHVCAVAGKNWIEVEYEGNKTNHGLWVICSKNRCVRWDEIYLILPGKLLSKTRSAFKTPSNICDGVFLQK